MKLSKEISDKVLTSIIRLRCKKVLLVNPEIEFQDTDGVSLSLFKIIKHEKVKGIITFNGPLSGLDLDIEDYLTAIDAIYSCQKLASEKSHNHVMFLDGEYKKFAIVDFREEKTVITPL